MNVLIIEDNRDLAGNLVDYLEAHGHVVDVAQDGLTGLHRAVGGGFDVIVLDLGLPGMDGLEVCRQLRSAGSAVPVLVLTARGELEQRVHGLEIGADDYLVKPVSLKELEARLRAQVRRARGELQPRILCVADLEVDERTRRVKRAGQEIMLTPRDYELLRALMRASPAVMTRAELERQLWGDAPPESDSLRSHVHTLRRAIDRPFGVTLLHTVYGVGYRLARETGDDATEG